jgi:FAD linked oxidases, C-terminal domain
MLIIPRTGTGEHGVGIGKKEFLTEELGEGTVNLMKTIKRAVDPLWLFNPGKVSPFLVFSTPYDTDIYSYLAVSRWQIFSLTLSRGLEVRYNTVPHDVLNCTLSACCFPSAMGSWFRLQHFWPYLFFSPICFFFESEFVLPAWYRLGGGHVRIYVLCLGRYVYAMRRAIAGRLVGRGVK